MGSLFDTPKAPRIPTPEPVEIELPDPPPAPKKVRMPTEQDPSLAAAAKRVKDRARSRGGRLSTILTDRG